MKSAAEHVDDAVDARLAREPHRYSLAIGGPGIFSTDDEGRTPSAVRYVWGAFSATATALCAYHGYARNKSVGSAVLWGIAGGVFPVFALPVALAQGFGQASTGNPFKVGDRVIWKTALETGPPCDTSPGTVTGVGAGVHDPFPGGHVVDDPAEFVEVKHDRGDTLAWPARMLVKLPT